MDKFVFNCKLKTENGPLLSYNLTSLYNPFIVKEGNNISSGAHAVSIQCGGLACGNYACGNSTAKHIGNGIVVFIAGHVLQAEINLSAKRIGCHI